MFSLPIPFNELVLLNSSNNDDTLRNVITIDEDNRWSDLQILNLFLLYF